VVLIRAVRGSISEYAPGYEVWSLTGLPAVELRRKKSDATLASLYGRRLRATPVVTVLQVGSRPATSVARLINDAARGFGDRPASIGTDGQPAPDAERRIFTAAGRRLDGRFVATARAHPGAVLLAVDTRTATRRTIRRDVDALTAVGANVVAVLVWVGRFPIGRGRPSWHGRRQQTTTEDRP
jgi:hypothetical protein